GPRLLRRICRRARGHPPGAAARVEEGRGGHGRLCQRQDGLPRPCYDGAVFESRDLRGRLRVTGRGVFGRPFFGSAGSIIPCRTGKFREQIRVGAALFAKNNVISDAYNAKLTPLGRSGRGSLTIFGWVELAYPIIAFMMRFDLDAKMA